MGLGKTIQAIALMLSTKENSEEHRQCLVITPSSLTINWENEIKKFAPSLEAVCLNGSAAERKKLFEDIDKYDVVITSYSTILRDIDKYENITFALQIIDEAQNIKNHNTQSAKAVKAIKSDLRFALTGTPIENTLAELWSIFDFVMPGYLYNYSYFKKNYETPIVKKNDEKAIKSLQRLISPFILRRMKKEVLTELPEKTETILFTEMEKEQKKIYTANAAQVRGELKELDSSDKIKILAMLTRLRQLCCDPSLVYDNYDGGSAKLEQCIELVKSCIEAGHKILLFSQFTSMLELLERELKALGIEYYKITGQTSKEERIKLVRSFNENEVPLF
ncbi:MAG: DEAD/DEAH box helicase family protein, partial [Clostridia bacterium]|nr:DEAD/DEAH box helicase family protein [Clostridia bacterium]